MAEKKNKIAYMSHIFFWNILISSILTVSAQDTTECSPEVVFGTMDSIKGFCLNKFIPQGDSCSTLQLNIKSHGIKIDFFCDSDHKWVYDGLHFADYKSQFVPIKIESILDEQENLKKIIIKLDESKDSSQLLFRPPQTGDIPVLPDTAKPIDFDISTSNFFCMDMPKATVILDRHFTYPGDYMRRDPDMNYPELSAFHWGSSVKIPTSSHIGLLGYYLIEMHQTSAPEFSTNELEEAARIEMWRNTWHKKHYARRGPKKVRPPRPKRLTFKPLD